MVDIRRHLPATLLILAVQALPAVASAQGPVAFTIEQVRSYPFPNELTAAATGSRIAWAFDEQGRRNIWVAEGPSFTPRRVTEYERDDGQALSSVSLSPDGQYIVYIRGGDFGSNWDDAQPVNPTFDPSAPSVQIWSVPFAGGAPKALGAGEDPVISPCGDVVAFERGNQILVAPIDGSAPARPVLGARGSNGSIVWEPSCGADRRARFAFVSNRQSHAFVGIFSGDSTPIRWIVPSTSRDGSPRWSPDGTRIAFVRRPGAGGAPDSILARRHAPWSIWTADVRTGQGRELWRAPTTLRGSYPTTHGSTNLHWAAGDRIVFLSTMDGWPHLYTIPAAGGSPLLLTPGRYMAEHIRMSPDRRFLVFAGNAGRDPLDIDRRHIVKVPVDRAAPEVLTPGGGLEWSPVVTGDGRTIAFIGATARRPPLPAVMPASGGTPRVLAEDRIPSGFPTAQLVVPKQVTFKAPDGTTIHGQLFERAGGPARKPAVIYVHGGPPRQMLLGWHYSDYYANAYALNQYLASRGFVVLSVNYRLGIGYGYEFRRPPDAGAQGASEYQDIRAAGEYLRSLPRVDGRRIGIYGGSYGGFLTALGLARDSDLFAAGVDIHGVHDWTTERARGLMNRDRFEEAPDLQRALEVAFRSGPVSSIAGWKSPVLLIHADDDRNVRFSQTVDLVRRLEDAGVPFELLVIPDDTHHFLRHENWLTVNRATAEFLERKLDAAASAAAR